jgi:predicted ferric reductase
MSLRPRDAFLLLSLYCALALAPLLVAYAGDVPSARSFWVEFAVGLGFVGLAILSLQFVLTGRFRTVAGSIGLDLMLQFHRQIGLVGFVFVLAHPVILFIADSAYLSFLDPRVNLPRAIALSAVIGALVLLIVTTLWRTTLGLTYEQWRAVHAALAVFVVFIGVVHILQVRYYVSPWWKQAMWIAATMSAITLLVNSRVVVPLRLLRTPYAVAQVREERGSAWTLVLRARGHGGLRFEPGQYVWLTLGSFPMTFQQHPFSVSSSAECPEAPELTVKALGDFTSTVGDVAPGTQAFLEGPYGAFTPTRTAGVDAIMIAGGVGITPLMSMLRTFRDREDPRSVLLIYGNSTWDDVLFRDEIDVLQKDIDLRVVHVLSDPPSDWKGETGYLTPDMLDFYLSDGHDGLYQYFVCGPEPMMDMVERRLIERGVALTDIYSERFGIV